MASQYSHDVTDEACITGFFQSIGVPDPEGAYEDIRRRYSAEGRAYHTMVHLVEGLDKMPDFIDQIEDKTAFMLAWLYHDIIYDAELKTNEEDSAVLMEEHARSWGIAEETIHKAKIHILATKHAGDKQYGDTAWLVDVDMSIVGAPLPRYQIYTRDVRSEYKKYTDKEWAIGRSGFLLTMGDRAENGTLFNTPLFNERCNNQVLTNIAWELKALDVTSIGPTRAWLSRTGGLEDLSRS